MDEMIVCEECGKQLVSDPSGASATGMTATLPEYGHACNAKAAFCMACQRQAERHRVLDHTI